MSNAARDLVIRRRHNALDDFSSKGITSGPLSIDQAFDSGVMTTNAKMIVGIATETDVGLDPSRYPWTVVLAASALPAVYSQTVSHYWPVIDSTGRAVSFQRRSEEIDRSLRNLYAMVTDFDEIAWNVVRDIRDSGVARVTAIDPAFESTLDVLLAHIQFGAGNPASVQEVNAGLITVVTTADASGRHPYVKLADNRYLLIKPAGSARAAAAMGPLNERSSPLFEYLATRHINNRVMAERYTDAPAGLIAACASSFAYATRYGLLETHAHKEYNVLEVTALSRNTFQVNRAIAATGSAVPAWMVPGTQIDMSADKIDPKMNEIAGGACVLAGFQHYLFNHTTGGTKLSGPLLGVALMYKLFDTSAVQFDEEQQTSVFYEALHPINKRQIANLAIKNSQVATYGRSSHAPEAEEIQMDTYVSLRSSIYPAGSHKAYLTLLVLMRICQANLGVFLPWNSEISSVINTCKTIMKGGARSHVGSGYYTGLPPLVQSGSLDSYLPDLAYYVQTLAKGDTLSLSPHLSPQIAAAASATWKNLINKVKSDDVSTTDPEVVMAFLHTTGSVRFGFDPADQATWAVAAKESSDAVDTIKEALS